MQTSLAGQNKWTASTTYTNKPLLSVQRPDPPHQVRHICKAHKADTQKQTLQKSLPCANASGTHPTSLDTYFQFDTPGRRVYLQHSVCCYAGWRIKTHLHIAISPYPADVILSAFVVIFIISFSISGDGSGLDIIKYQHSSKPSPLPASLLGNRILIKIPRHQFFQTKTTWHEKLPMQKM